MPATLTYPGVYIEELPSGVRTITGVATSITAFIGRARKGPVNVATTVNSYGEFESLFGGLWDKSSLAFAVRDFFLNGGGQAVIVRLYHAQTNGTPPPAKMPITPGTISAPPAPFTFSAGALTFEAANEGRWGEALRVVIDTDVSAAVAMSLGLATSDLFNLTVTEAAPGGASETFRNLSVKDSPRRVDNVLKNGSRLLRWKGSIDQNNLPAVQAGKDPISAWEATLAAAKAVVPPVAGDVSAAQSGLDTAKAAAVANDGVAVTLADDFTPVGAETAKLGLYALEQVDLFNLLVIPPYLASGDVDASLVSAAAAYCEKRRAMLLVDPLSTWTSKSAAKTGMGTGVGTVSKNAAIFFPRLAQPNPLHDNQFEPFVPSGAVAGVMARTDANRGVWKAPAGLDATLNNVPALSVNLTDAENGELNPLGLNCLRTMPGVGRIVWGARTLQGDDRLASEWKYIPVRRLALFLEESLYRGTQWVVFEPNDEPLWAQIRLNLGAFMNSLFRQGAFQGKTPAEAYLVKCDKETTTQDDINRGVVNILVAFAPLKPAEFVVIKIQQLAGQIQT